MTRLASSLQTAEIPLLAACFLRIRHAAGFLVCAAALAVAAPMNARAQSIFSNTTSNAIPNPNLIQGPAALYPAPVTVSGLGSNVTNITVSFFNLSHSYAADIDVLLVGPGGQNVLLMSDCGTYFPISNLNLTFSDAAAGSLPELTQLASGTFKPTNYDQNFMVDSFASPAPNTGPYGSALSIFNGTNPNGVWSLYIIDDTQGNGGVMAGGWSITVTAVPEPSSLALGALAAAGLGGWYVRRRGRAAAVRA